MKVKDVMTTSVKTIKPTGRAVAQGTGGASIRDVGASDVVYCFEDQDVQEAATLMQENQIRRVVVLNRGKKIVGIVSLSDVAVETSDDEKTAHLKTTEKKPQRNKQHRLQEVLPQVSNVAQTVGGFKQLAEIAKTLDQSKE